MLNLRAINAYYYYYYYYYHYCYYYYLRILLGMLYTLLLFMIYIYSNIGTFTKYHINIDSIGFKLFFLRLLTQTQKVHTSTVQKIERKLKDKKVKTKKKRHN